jgi:DNA-binding GntR family transcriptional regulator
LELEAIGVVQFAHNRGAVVKPFGSAQLREIYQLRRILEVEATRCACGRIDTVALEQLQGELVALRGQRRGKQWLEREMDTDRQLHGMIAAACGSLRLAEELRRYDTLVQSLRDVVRDNCDARQEALDEHVGIVEALLAADAETAASRMSQHVDRAARSIISVMFAET